MRRLSPIHDDEGEVDIVIGIGMDISEMVEKDVKIQSISRFPDENPNPVLRISLEGVILFANNPAMENFLLPYDLKLGDTISENYNYLMNLADSKTDRIERILKMNNKTFSVQYIKIPNEEKTTTLHKTPSIRPKTNEKGTLNILISKKYFQTALLFILCYNFDFISF